MKPLLKLIALGGEDFELNGVACVGNMNLRLGGKR
jgi:hypothetical protein